MIDLTSKDLRDQLCKKIDFENGKKKIKYLVSYPPYDRNMVRFDPFLMSW